MEEFKPDKLMENSGNVFCKMVDLWDGGVQAPVILPKRHREKLLCTCLRTVLKSSLFNSAVMLNIEPQTAT